MHAESVCCTFDGHVDRVLQGDALSVLAEMPSEIVSLVISSPPYFRLRTYAGLEEEIGREASVEDYLASLVRVVGECLRVTRPDGHVVINLGDKYDDGGLRLIPHRFAARVLDEFRTVRLINTVTWAKSNPTPSPQRRRLTNATEPFFDFAKSKDFYVDAETPIKDTRPSQCADWKDAKSCGPPGFQGRKGARIGQGYHRKIDESALSSAEKANARRDLDAVLEEVRLGAVHDIRMKIRGMHALPFGGQAGGRMNQIASNGYTIIRFRGNPHHLDWIECPVETLRGIGHPAVYPQRLIEKFIRRLTKPGDLVLDPFLGSGTTALACLATGRHWLGIELSPEFVAVAEKRIAKAMEREAAPGPLGLGQPHHERQLTA